jgi:hypothetical protein
MSYLTPKWYEYFIPLVAKYAPYLLIQARGHLGFLTTKKGVVIFRGSDGRIEYGGQMPNMKIMKGTWESPYDFLVYKSALYFDRKTRLFYLPGEWKPFNPFAGNLFFCVAIPGNIESNSSFTEVIDENGKKYPVVKRENMYFAEVKGDLVPLVAGTWNDANECVRYAKYETSEPLPYPVVKPIPEEKNVLSVSDTERIAAMEKRNTTKFGTEVNDMLASVKADLSIADIKADTERLRKKYAPKAPTQAATKATMKKDEERLRDKYKTL